MPYRSCSRSLVAFLAGAVLISDLPAQEAERKAGLANFILKPGATAAASNTEPRRTRSNGQRSRVERSKVGPWGQIEYFTTQLEVPLHLLQLWEVPSLSLDWQFKGVPAAEVEKLFKSVEMPAALRSDLLAPSKWRTENGAVIVSPSEKTIEDLPAAARSAIYSVLARFPENPFQFEPIIVPGGDVARWLGADALRPEVMAMIQKTLHLRGKATVFSDKALVLRQARSDDERLQIRKVLSRTPALVCKVVLDEHSDATKLAEYWSAGRRMKEIEPFLESMIETDGVDHIDLVHLLPASVRKLIYTFPNETHGRGGYYPDCHWSSLNFFNYDPLERLAEPPLATAYTIENYTEVSKPERFGDILFLMDKKTGNAYHSCVYIADDIVYSKNGRSRLSPWVLMKLDAVQQLYGIYQETSVVTYRLKSLK